MSDIRSASGKNRYARQLLLSEIGAAGQARLATARVLVIGAGGLGTPALFYLAAAGTGTIGIADDDCVEISNLHRQILYAQNDVGRRKTDAAAERLRAFNSDIQIETIDQRVDSENAVELISAYDLVLDATDGLDTKFLINDAAAVAGRPLVYASALGLEAQVAVFDAATGPCLRCLFQEFPALPAATCAQAGVLGAVTGIAGSLQALEAIKWVAGRCHDGTLQTLHGRLWLLDGRTLTTRVVKLPRDPACRICSGAVTTAGLPRTAPRVSTIRPEELEELADVLMIDVRENEEWQAGHLEGAVHLPLSRLVSSPPPELPPRATYVVYCAHGIRSQTAARMLAAAGYLNVTSLAGGLAALETGENSD